MSDPQYFERAQPGWQMISGGIYLDQEQNLHLFPGELLVAAGWPNTEENRAIICEIGPDAVREALAQTDLPAFITSRDGKVERR